MQAKEYYLQVGKSRKYISADYRNGTIAFSFTHILTNATGYESKKQASAALELMIKRQEEKLAVFDEFKNLVLNADEQTKAKLLELLLPIATSMFQHDQRYYRSVIPPNKERSSGYMCYAINECLKHSKFVDEFKCIAKLAEFVDIQSRRTNWDENTNWFAIKKKREYVDGNWLCEYDSCTRQLKDLKRCKPAKPILEHTLHFRKVPVKPKWVLCKANIHCDCCGVNILNMKYLAVNCSKTSHKSHICPVCLKNISEQLQDELKSIDPELILLHKKTLFINAIN
jgi:hypothetical protein